MRDLVRTTTSSVVGSSAVGASLVGASLASGVRSASTDAADFARSPHRLAWRGRTWAPGQLAPGTSTCQLDERYGDGTHRVVRGDVLDVARTLVAEGLSANLVYVDPPFASQTSYTHEARLDGRADGRVHRARAYDDSWPAGAYLDMLAPRLEALASLLAPEGTLWVHVDWRAAYLVRALLDEILGPERFVNEIVWRRAPNLGRQAASAQFGRTLDTIVVYGGPKARLVPPTRLEPIEPGAIRRDDGGRPFTLAPRGDYTDASVARLEKEGRIHRTSTGKVYVKYFLVENSEGRLCRERRIDSLWTDVAPLRHAAVSERTGYPTQKPRALLERIIAAATKPGDTVVDLFCGSGTTGDAAHATGRRAVLGDVGAIGLATTRARLLRAGAGLSMQKLDAPRATNAAKATTKITNAAKVTCVARGSALDVELVTPEEPLAWAVGTRERGGPFMGLWHSERVPGTRPKAAERRATISRAPHLVARVYEDDGTIHECPVPASAAARRGGA